MPNTHCLPSGSLGTGELPVANVAIGNTSVLDPGVGNRRGICVNLHGLGESAPSTYPIPLPGNPSGLYTFMNDVVSDGWVFWYPAYNEDFYSGLNDQGIVNDVSNDTGHGTRYLASTLHWWTHQLQTIAATYGPNRPLILTGFSWGSIKTLQILANMQSTMIGAMVQCPPTICENVNPGFIAPPVIWYTTNWSGFNLSDTFLTSMSPALSFPILIGYGLADVAVGWGGDTTITSGSNGVDVATLTGSTAINVASSSNFISGFGPNIKITGLTGGTGSAVLTYTGTGAGVLNGCNTISGSGVLATGNPVIQSTTATMISNAVAASLPVTGNAVVEGHNFSNADAATWLTFIQTNYDPHAPANAF